MARPDGRANDQLRPVEIVRRYTKFAAGSALISIGDTKVICTAQIDDRPPRFMQDEGARGRGWVTAEYEMLPGSTPDRSQRSRTRIGGRTSEIQRLIGRALRAATDTNQIGERTIWVDCDVIQADGGTRCASITGGFVALMDALRTLEADGKLGDVFPIKDYVAAVSVGVVGGNSVLDLPYVEDSKAEVDMNVIMNGAGEFVEVQGTGEEGTFSRDQMNALLDLATVGNHRLISLQKKLFDEDLDVVRSGD
ncbi:MAG: ribonuclease PH [Candidatus Poribacteria bacterium]|nr:ribonuclease PH [Candidatus Poribacteria bacterium]